MINNQVIKTTAESDRATEREHNELRNLPKASITAEYNLPFKCYFYFSIWLKENVPSINWTGLLRSSLQTVQAPPLASCLVKIQMKEYHYGLLNPPGNHLETLR